MTPITDTEVQRAAEVAMRSAGFSHGRAMALADLCIVGLGDQRLHHVPNVGAYIDTADLNARLARESVSRALCCRAERRAVLGNIQRRVSLDWPLGSVARDLDELARIGG